MGKHLSAARITRKDRNIGCFMQKENKNQKKSTWNNWITLKRKFPSEINGEIDLL